MLYLYAQTLMTATRSGCVCLRDVTPVSAEKRSNWFSRRKVRCIDPAKL